MKRYKAYIFDLDGTLFRGDEPIAGAADVVANLRSEGAGVRYLTNNSTRTRSFFAEKLQRMGFQASEEEVYSSAIGTARFLEKLNLRKIYLIGEDGLRHTLSESGIEIAEAHVDAVVVGLSKTFDYDQMNQAMQLIREGAKFIATNPDPTYPMEGGKFIPGAGSVVAAVRACSETEPFVIGKPNPFLVELVLSEAGIMPQDAIVIGDRMDTDIESGIRAGCDTFLVLSGAESEAPVGQRHAQDVTGLL